MSPKSLVFSLPVFSIIFARILYAINWFNISSIFYLILVDFRQDVSMLGLITSSFLIGIGLFQIPAGILSAKYDPKLIIVGGTLLLSTASLLTGFVSEIYQMVILRFLVGVGMAFFFGPSVIIISNYLGKGSEGLGVGMLNSAHSLGGIIGVFGWIILADLLGWRTGLVFGGILGLFSGVLLSYSLFKRQYLNDTNMGKKFLSSMRRITELFNGSIHYKFNHRISVPNSQISLKNLKKIMTNKSILLVALSLLGVQIGWMLVSTFIIVYLKIDLGLTSALAGLIGMTTLIVNVLFAPVFGKIYDHFVRKKCVKLDVISLVSCGLIIAVCISLFSLAPLHLLIPLIVIIGIFASGGFVIPYTLARRIVVENMGMPYYDVLAISYVNGISLLGAFWAPILFSFMVKGFGYSIAWLTGGLLIAVFIIPIIRLRL
ncbi:MAG TPA: MFS transporter [Nitrososphaeraceae archaeon]|nr:MFS transporter [Nitrososphaeraceae archaeon]